MCAVQSKLTPISATCIEYVHPWTDSCTIATAGLILRAAQESLRIYSAVYTLSLLMRFRVPTLNDLKRTALGIIQSTGFLTTSAFTYVLFLCILRKCFGNYNFFTVSYVPAFMSSMCAILIERPSRRGLLCLYVSNVATETLFNMACSRNICRPIPYGQVMIFGVSIATLLYYYRKGMHLTAVQSTNPINNNTIVMDSVSKDSIFDIIRFVVGRHEEHMPLQLAHQPQYMARRRERHASAAAGVNDSPPSTAAAAGQRRPNANLFYSVIMQAVQYYVKCVRYIKYSMARHRTCPHARNSCIHYALQGGTKLFTIGVGLQVTLKCLLQMKAIFRQPAAQLKRIFGSRDTLKLGAFLGGFAALFRLVSCGLRHILDKDDPSSAIPAALIASIAFASYPDKTVALYVMWKMLQLSYNMGCDAGYLPKVPHSTLFLYCASTATLFHAAILEPTNLRSSYWKFLHSLSGGRVAGMDRLPLDVYGLGTSKQLEQVLALTKTCRDINYVF